MLSNIPKPSSLIHEIELQRSAQWHLFRFSERLQSRMEILLERRKAEQLTVEEMSELEMIAELDRIFTHINAMLSADYVNK